jgi:hypothetical protein
MNRVVSLPGRIAAVLAPLAAAALLVPFRTSLQHSTIVLVFVVVVVAVATTGDRVAAVLAAVVSAASFDFFLTRPYLSLRITSANDLETTAMLLVIGLIVGELAAVGHRRRLEAQRAREELDVLERVAARIAEEPGTLELIDVVADELTELLDLESCHFSLARPEGPELRSDGRVDVDRHVWVGDEFALPLAGAVLAVTSGGDQLGWFSLVPGRPVGVPLEARRVAVALACQLANALARGAHQG